MTKKQHPPVAIAEAPQTQAALQEAIAEDVEAVLHPVPDEAHPIYEPEWNFCLTMAFMHSGADYLTDWGDIPLRLANFMTQNPDAPVEAALIEVKLRTRVVILPNEDQRRVHLALQIFRAYVLGWHAIDKEDGEKRRLAAEQAAYVRPQLDPTDTAFEVEDGPFDALSDMGKAAMARAKGA